MLSVSVRKGRRSGRWYCLQLAAFIWLQQHARRTGFTDPQDRGNTFASVGRTGEQHSKRTARCRARGGQ